MFEIKMSDDKKSGAGINPGYAASQLAKALGVGAGERAQKWISVLGNILSGSLTYGSRAPIPDSPVWATPEVVTGGFATGKLLAAGPLRPHEVKLLEALPNRAPDGGERAALHGYFLSAEGFPHLAQMLDDGCFDVGVPEEGALLSVAWLAENGFLTEAQSLLEQIAPYFSQFRFYPVPRNQPRESTTRVHLQTVGATVRSLAAIGPNTRVLAQKEAVHIWAPFHDRVVALFLETVADTWPCRTFPKGWQARARKLLREYGELRSVHTLCRKMDRPGQHYRQLRELLGKCAVDPASLTGKEVGRIRLILTQYQQKRGSPDSSVCKIARQKQAGHVAAPTYHDVAKAVIPRLSQLAQDEGVDDIEPFCEPVSAGTPLPEPIRRRMERCLNETVDELVKRGFITSGDTLARLLPQITSEIRAAGFADPKLQRLYSAVYQAFRRRRSLLLLHLQRQVQIEELPWIKALEPLRTKTTDAQSRNLAREVVLLTLESFPHAILPNRLLQELRALTSLPLVDELAVDIFMGRFSNKYVTAARRSLEALAGTIYSRYYRLDSCAFGSADAFAKLCERRANVARGTRDTVTNGMVIEQQQILTSQNLAVLCSELGLIEALQPRLVHMAERCLSWILYRQQVHTRDWHPRLLNLKNTAYAWRQMLFFLSFVTPAEAGSFVQWAEVQLLKQPDDFQKRFRPALNGLKLAAEGRDFEDGVEARRFLGWSKDRHWLLPSDQG